MSKTACSSLFALILIAAVARLSWNLNQALGFDPISALAAAQRQLISDPDDLTVPGVTGVDYQRFDPEALFVAMPGPDRMPGRAGVDDNLDGNLDDRLELGATRSDDRCRVINRQELAELPDGERIVLQQGAFVAADQDNFDRAIVLGRSNGRPWSMVVEAEGGGRKVD